MKQLILALVLALQLVVLGTMTAFAQGPRAGDRFCSGGATVVESNEFVDSVILFGCGARISSGARVAKDVVSFGGQVIVEAGARVGSSVVVIGSGGPVQIAGSVGRDVVVIGDDLVLESTAEIGRDVAAVGGDIERKEGAIVRGNVSRGEAPRNLPTPPVPPSANVPPIRYEPFSVWTRIASGLLQGVLGTLALAGLGVLIVALWPQQTIQVGHVARVAALPSLGVGCLTILVGTLLGIAFLITLCGIPIALVIFLLLTLAWLVGVVALGELVGDKILESLRVRESLRTPIVAVIIGVLLFALFSAAPLFIGWFFALCVATLGIGAVVLSRFGTRPYPQTLAPAVSSTPAAPTDVSPST